MDKKSQNTDKNGHQRNGSAVDSKEEQTNEKTGYEASDIIEDALQLAVDDELKDDREDLNNESGHSSKVNINSSDNEVNSQKYNQDSTPEQTKAMLSPPKPETAPVVAPLTIEDKISMDTSKLRNSGTDEASMIVNLDDTNTDLLESDIDGSLDVTESNQNKTNRKSNNENSSDSKSVSVNENKNSSNEEINPSPKDMNKISEKDSSKSKSSNQRESKVKSKESKNGTVNQKGQANSKNNIWVSGLSQNTKACELQTIFSKHGKVVSAKIIKNARMSGSRCFGFITMESSEQVLKCIAQLNKTELHGRNIALSRNRPQESASKPAVARSKPNSAKREVNKNTAKESEVKETKIEEKSDENKTKKPSEERLTNKTLSDSGSNKGSETKADKRKPIRPPVRDRPLFPRRPMIPFKRPIPLRRPFPTNSIRGFHRPGFGPGFGRGGLRPNLAINRQDIDRNIRERERERRIREERRRREEILRVDLEREERIRFEREKERLKLERMKLEREKAEFFKFERERAKLEREKIEREREELRRRQQSQSLIQHRVEDSRSRSAIVTSTLGKRPFESRDMRSTEPYWEERKRVQNIQRIDSHLIPSRQSFVESSSSVGNRHSIPHSYENRNDSYKRNTRIEIPLTGNSRTEFDVRRHDSRHTIGHDRDDRKSTGGPSYYRGDSSRNTSFPSRDRRLGASQREEWKSGHDSRRSDRYSDKPMTGGSNTGFAGNSRYGSDSRGWSDRSSNSLNKMSSYGSANIHMSGSQTWTPSVGGRWNSAINSSSESRSRGQSSHNTSMLSGANPSITELFGSTPMSGIGLNISHSMAGNAGNSLGSGDRPYIHSNRRF